MGTNLTKSLSNDQLLYTACDVLCMLCSSDVVCPPKPTLKIFDRLDIGI